MIRKRHNGGTFMLTGRRQIFTDEHVVNKDNVVKVITDSMSDHLANRSEINILYDYYKGRQPIFHRHKRVRNDILNRICENRANEIVSFKVGYTAGEPIQYVARTSEASDEVSALNELMLSLSKPSIDKELVEWAMICGTAYRIVLPDRIGIEIHTLDPRNAFVVYENNYKKTPLCGVVYTEDKSGIKTYDVYTKYDYFQIKDSKITQSSSHMLGDIPIIEYPANNARLGCFEPVTSLLDALNELDSSRLDGVQQFIQSLIVCYNCEFEEGVTSEEIQERGLVLLKSLNENKADIKIIAEELNQTQTQTLKNDLYNAILTICGVPSQGDGMKSDSSNNGAVILKNGWQQAEARAKDYELMFKMSEKKMLELVLRMLGWFNILTLDVKDVDYRFTRRNYEDVLTKSQVLVSMLGCEKIEPKLAFNACGLFSDPETAYMDSMDWYNSHKEETDESRPEELSLGIERVE